MVRLVLKSVRNLCVCVRESSVHTVCTKPRHHDDASSINNDNGSLLTFITGHVLISFIIFQGFKPFPIHTHAHAHSCKAAVLHVIRHIALACCVFQRRHDEYRFACTSTALIRADV